MERDNTTPYLTGNFVISSLERTDPAQEDATYTIQLENSGEVTFDETGITETATTTTDASA
jgi:predicted secreted protein